MNNLKQEPEEIEYLWFKHSLQPIFLRERAHDKNLQKNWMCKFISIVSCWINLQLGAYILNKLYQPTEVWWMLQVILYVWCILSTISTIHLFSFSFILWYYAFVLLQKHKYKVWYPHQQDSSIMHVHTYSH